MSSDSRTKCGSCRTHPVRLALVLCFVLTAVPVFGAAAGRAIIQDGTVKTADGVLLRGCHAHIGRSVNSGVRDFFTNLDNVVRMRDEAHLNVIRIALLTPGWGGYSTVDEALPYVDAIVDNCEAAGVYAIVNYHGPFQESGQWVLKEFWTKVAPRYDDRTFVIYNMLNESMQCGCSSCALPLSRGGTPTGWGVTVAKMDTVYQIMGAAAPQTMIFGVEPVNIECDWGGWLRDYYGPQLGIDWEAGKDAFSFHTYVASSGDAVRATMSHGVPIINSEYSFSQEGWPLGPLDGETCHAEFMEKHGLSHIVWQEWQGGNANQLESIMSYLVADAVANDYAWWNVAPPSAPRNVSVQVLSTHSASLSWDPPSGVGHGIIRYYVLRDGEIVGQTTQFEYVDEGLADGTTHGYEVMALAVGSVRGERSTRVEVTTDADQTAPTVTFVNGAGDCRMVHATFSEPVDPASAQTASNYTLDKGETVSSAMLLGDNMTVKLVTSYMAKNETFTLTVNNVADRAADRNTVAPNTAVAFVCIDGVTKIRYCPRIGYADRMESGVFEGTNGDKDAGPYTVLHELQPLETQADQWNAIVAFNRSVDIGYRHIRYRGPDGSHCEIADMDFWYGRVEATGTPFGSQASGPGNDLSQAFDGSIQTFYQATTANDGYAGLELDKTVGNATMPAPWSTRTRPALRVWQHGTRTGLTIDGLGAHAAAQISLYSLQGSLVTRVGSLACRNGRAQLHFDPRTQLLCAGQYVVEVRAGGIEMIERVSIVR